MKYLIPIYFHKINIISNNNPFPQSQRGYVLIPEVFNVNWKPFSPSIADYQLSGKYFFHFVDNLMELLVRVISYA